MNFIQTFQTLYHSQPFKDVWSNNTKNCPYGDFIFNSRNCYLSFELGGSRDCLYMDNSMKCTECADCSFCKYCELCSESLYLEKSFHCHYCHYSQHCSDCYYSAQLFNCQHCLGCYALKHKKFYIFNQPYSETDYQTKKKELLARPEKIWTGFNELKNKIGYPATHLTNSYDCFGDFMIDSHDCYYCFDVNSNHNSAYLYSCLYNKSMQDSFDIDNAGNCELCSNSFSIGISYNSHYCLFSSRLVDCLYCARCKSCEKCFGCVYLSPTKYYIWNQPYEPAEYEKKIAEIKKYFAENNISDVYSLINK